MYEELHYLLTHSKPPEAPEIATRVSEPLTGWYVAVVVVCVVYSVMYGYLCWELFT